MLYWGQPAQAGCLEHDHCCSCAMTFGPKPWTCVIATRPKPDAVD